MLGYLGDIECGYLGIERHYIYIYNMYLYVYIYIIQQLDMPQDQVNRSLQDEHLSWAYHLLTMALIREAMAACFR